MTTLHEHGEPCRALDLLPREIVQSSAAREAFRALLGDDARIAVGWPVFTASTTARAADVTIELARAGSTSCELALRIPSEHAARWVDRALGGNGESGLAGASGRLSDGECGVLAYLTSQVCLPLASFHVRDVHYGAERDAAVHWPIHVESARGHAALTCVLAPSLAEALSAPHRLRVSVFDLGPAAFRAGEVWISDRWNLGSTSEGLAGEVHLAVEGCTNGLSAIAGEGQVRAHGPSAAREGVELVLAEQRVSFERLARIAAGEPQVVSFHDTVELRDAHGTHARGELISWRGAVGVRISEA